MNDIKGLSAGGVLAGLMLMLLSCGGQNDSLKGEGAELDNEGKHAQGEPVILFDTLEHDFGTIIEGESVVCYFDYQNRGGEDLLITGVEATCGCTIPSWSREPLKPGAEETMEVIFDASGRSGEQRKLITVKSNASNQEVRLTIKATVINNVS